MTELKEFQRSLNTDEDAKRHFVDADVDEDSDEDSESPQIQISAPKPKKKNNVDSILIAQLISQQQAYNKAQKIIYKLKTEIETEEVKTRYIKLDLNNAQVKIEELTEKNKTMSKVWIENVCFRIIILFYVFWHILRIF